MRKQDAISMILNIVVEVDCDIYKQAYAEATAEEPECVDDNINTLLKIVEQYIEIE